MNIKPFVNQATSIVIQGYEKGKTAVLWCGHQIKIGYLDYFIPGTKKLTALAIKAFDLIQKTAHTRPGMLFAVAGGLLIAGIAVLKIGNSIENRLFRSAFKVIGVASLIGVAGLAGIGIYTIGMA